MPSHAVAEISLASNAIKLWSLDGIASKAERQRRRSPIQLAEAFAARGALHFFVLAHDRRALAALRCLGRVPSLGDLHRSTTADTRNRFTHQARSTSPF